MQERIAWGAARVWRSCVAKQAWQNPRPEGIKSNFMYKLLFVAFLFIARQGLAQTPAQADTGSVIVNKDPRLDSLVQKQIEINELTTRDARRNVPGFRIQVMNSPD